MLAAGATVPRMHNSGEGIEDDGNDATMPPHSWSSINPEKFLVRQGPDYAVRKQKARSVGPSLFRLHAVDWYKAGKRLAKAGGLVQLPKAEFSHPLVPSLLIVNVQLPLEVSDSLVLGGKKDFVRLLLVLDTFVLRYTEYIVYLNAPPPECVLQCRVKDVHAHGPITVLLPCREEVLVCACARGTMLLQRCLDLLLDSKQCKLLLLLTKSRLHYYIAFSVSFSFSTPESTG